jgi:ATP phosphoribosyltransferase
MASKTAAKPLLKIGLPKGSLQNQTFHLLKKAGFTATVNERSYFPTIDDAELSAMLIKAKEMARYVEQGVMDCGIVGRDWVLEQNADVVEIAELNYAKSGLKPVRWVLAVPNDSTVKTISDLKGKRIATELVRYTEKFFKKRKVKANIEFSWGATEAKPPLLADAIVDLTETGASLRANNLREVETILISSTVFIANKKSWQNPEKRKKMENLNILIQGAIHAETKVGLKMNVPDKALKKVMSLLPALQTPTLASLADSNWHSLEVIIDEHLVRELIPDLKRAGATGLVEYPLNKVVY